MLTVCIQIISISVRIENVGLKVRYRKVTSKQGDIERLSLMQGAP